MTEVDMNVLAMACSIKNHSIYWSYDADGGESIFKVQSVDLTFIDPDTSLITPIARFAKADGAYVELNETELSNFFTLTRLGK